MLPSCGSGGGGGGVSSVTKNMDRPSKHIHSKGLPVMIHCCITPGKT